jgi:carboxypeptidase Q
MGGNLTQYTSIASSSVIEGATALKLLVTNCQLRGVSVAAALIIAALASPQAQAPASTERVDLDAIYKIKDEGFQRSQVMETVSYLTDINGPRLTNSPNIRKAADWAAKKLTEWGIANVHQETWGPFGRGWWNEKFTVNVLSPQPFPLIAFPKAWTPGTNGAVSADAMMAVIEDDADFAKWTGKLRGKIVLAAKPLPVKALFEPTGRRFSEKDLDVMEEQEIDPERRGPNFRANQEKTRKRMEFFAREGVVAVIEPGNGRSDHGAILVGGPRELRDAKATPQPPQIVVATEHYGRIARTLEKNIPVKIELNAQNRYQDEILDSFNIVGEIPGTDKADEVVMLGAHFDSWHAGTGSTDNAAGSAAMMEAIRILKASGLKMRRTVRLALWTGEEQGLLGSRAYVKKEFGDPDTMQLKPAHAKLAGYFNMDNGTGAIRGVYMQGNEAVQPIFAGWMAPFKNIGMTTLTIRGTGSTDHIPFDEVGLPGFQFIQDPVEYSTYSHHTNMDLYERIQPDDMMKNAVIIASFVYHTANRDERLPRKTLPKPRNPRPTTTQ